MNISGRSIESIIGDFYNITLTRNERKRLDGLNVRIERKDYRVTKFFPFKNFSTKEDTLKAAIECRNTHYQSAGFPPFLCRQPAQGIAECAKSPTGWHGIRIREKKDSRRKSTRKHISFACPVAETGAITTKDIPLSKFDENEALALKEAIKIKAECVDKYNRIVPVFNDLIMKSVEAACMTELRTLNPTIQYVRNNVPRLWEQAFRIVK